MQLRIFEDEIAAAEGGAVSDYQSERSMARAAEYLVAYDISRRGFDCFTVGEGLQYDLIADLGGLRRIQVKSNRRAVYRHPNSVSLSYTFGNGKGLLKYTQGADLLAFVALDRMAVLYSLPSQIKREQLHIAASIMTPESSDLSWAEVMREWQPAK